MPRLHNRAVTVATLLGILFSHSACGSIVTVGNPGNAADVLGFGEFGAVSYKYNISTTEVSNAEYAAFLNAVATVDTNSLYNTGMAGIYGGITRSGASGSYTYATASGRENNPVVYVSFYDALRYANWLHSGQPTGGQDNSTTEDGAYTITAAGISAKSITRNAGATWFLTSEDEWYKAAYYDPTLNGGLGGYFDYATSSNTAPTAEVPPGGINSANHNGVVGNTTANGNTTPVGAYATSLSPYGTLDQSGNVLEWNDAMGNNNRIMRGGAFNNASGPLSRFVRFQLGATNENVNIGFRVGSLYSPASVVPEPSTFAIWSLLGLVGAGVQRRRRRKAA